MALVLPLPLVAQDLTVLSEARHGDWIALELRGSGDRRLCAAETKVGNAVFRINYYDPRDSFVEIFPLPRGRSGPVSLMFDGAEYDLRVDATRYETAWIVDLTDTRMTGAMLLVLRESGQLAIRAEDREMTLSLRGSSRALDRFVACTRRLHLAR